MGPTYFGVRFFVKLLVVVLLLLLWLLRTAAVLRRKGVPTRDGFLARKGLHSQ